MVSTLALADGEALALGRPRLRALLTPMVHWPETMMTFEESERVLFTGDVFGGYGALGAGFAVADREPAQLEPEFRRYYANVLGKYSGMVRKALARVAAADPAVLVPSHGPVWEGGGALVRGWVEAVRRGGGLTLTVVEPNYDPALERDLKNVGAVLNPPDAGPVDVLVLAVKPQQFAEAAGGARRFVGPRR